MGEFFFSSDVSFPVAHFVAISLIIFTIT